MCSTRRTAPQLFCKTGRLTAQLTCRTGTSYTPEISASQYTLILRNHLGAPARATPGCSEIIESCITRTQHLATTRTQRLATPRQHQLPNTCVYDHKFLSIGAYVSVMYQLDFSLLTIGEGTYPLNTIIMRRYKSILKFN